MNDRKTSCALAVFYVAAIFLTGCIPEGSLEWSEDGSVGLLRTEGALYLVDGKTGELTTVAEANVGLLPDISEDGSLIAYSEKVDCDSLSEGLRLLPPGQVRMIEHYAEYMKKKYLEAHAQSRDVKPPFPLPEKGLLHPNNYWNWAVRYLCEMSDDEFLETLESEEVEKGKEAAISYFQVVVLHRENPADKRVVLTANVFTTMATRLSPDGKSVAYLMHTQEGEVNNAFEEYGLYVASLETDIKAMLVDSPVAFGYDWREDGKAIAYLSADSKNLRHDDFILATLGEKMVVDANGSLLAEPTQSPEHGAAGTHRCTGKAAELVGAVYSPWLKVQYGPDDRIFFSSFALPLPVSKRDEPGCSLFCYDPVTATVTDVLPLSVSSHTREQVFGMAQFALSPDGKHVLLPIKHNRFIVYAMGTDSTEIPIPEEEKFGEEELPELAPSWKGGNEISFLVSENSKFLPKAEKKAARKEIVVLNRTDGGSWVLSENWSDEMMSGSHDSKEEGGS